MNAQGSRRLECLWVLDSVDGRASSGTADAGTCPLREVDKQAVGLLYKRTLDRTLNQETRAKDPHLSIMFN